MDFYALYTSVGLWNAVYVIMYAITNATKLMKYSTRSTEEIFALFICIAFTVDAFKDAYSDFRKNYLTEECAQFDALVSANVSSISSGNELRLSDITTGNMRQYLQRRSRYADARTLCSSCCWCWEPSGWPPLSTTSTRHPTCRCTVNPNPKCVWKPPILTHLGATIYLSVHSPSV